MRVALLVSMTFVWGCLDLEVARFAQVRADSSLRTDAVGAPTGVGRSCVTMISLVPLDWPPSLGDAVASAAGGGPLTDVVVRYELRYVPLIYGRGCYVVEGRTP
jgi:hypothetical protein